MTVLLNIINVLENNVVQWNCETIIPSHVIVKYEIDFGHLPWNIVLTDYIFVLCY